MIFLNDLKNIFFTESCIICKNAFYFDNQNAVCNECLRKIKKTPAIYCKSCGAPTENCQKCLKLKKYDYIQVFSSRTEKIIKLIAEYKLNKIKGLSKDIADIIRDDITTFVKEKEIDLITYVPISKKVYREREFNHLREILLHIFPRYLIKEVLIKVRETDFQANLDKKDRLKNLKNAFKLKGNIKNKKILVFDDILTTGSTLNEIYKEIKKGKPEKIYGYVIVR